jgi:hypothetical protein
MRVLPPSRRKAFSCSSAQMRELERNVGKRAVTERHYEQPRAATLTALRVAHHGASAVIDLRFFSRRRNDYGSRLERLISAQLANEAFDCPIASAEPSLGD